MAEATEFDHDQLGHLLADQLLEVPRFQRSSSWDESNVEEHLSPDAMFGALHNVDLRIS